MLKPDRKLFAESLDGQRIQLVLANPMLNQKIWASLQRDHALGGKNYAWIQSLEDVAHYITRIPDPNSHEIDYMILKDQQVIGSAHIHTISYADYRAEIGYALEKGEEGNGYASEAVQLLLAEMKRLGFRKAIICCEKRNTRSINVAVRNAFVFEGVVAQDASESNPPYESMKFGLIL